MPLCGAAASGSRSDPPPVAPGAATSKRAN
jgi:hypothetical protein